MLHLSKNMTYFHHKCSIFAPQKIIDYIKENYGIRVNNL